MGRGINIALVNGNVTSRFEALVGTSCCWKPTYQSDSLAALSSLQVEQENS